VLSRLFPLSAWAVLALLLIGPNTGCVGLTVQIANMLGMQMVPAEYAGLRGRRVAVVCQVPDNGYGPETASESLAIELERYLRSHVKQVTFVPRHEVNNWLDVHADRLIDYARMGKSLKADKVLLVEFGSFSYRDNATLYQGRADFNITVFDTETGEREYEFTEPDMVFPSDTAYHLTDMSDDKFRRAFIAWIAADIGRRFHMNDFPKQFAKEPAIDLR
jgi:hypothetical protein